jgi:acetyltransferase-like isoleucine patch superfamily enzyme
LWLINFLNHMETSFYSPSELQEMGFGSLGSNVLISRKASVYSPHLMQIGDHVRVDDFCILSGAITLGSYIHISAYTALYGRNGISVADFATISGRVLIYSQNDDYSGEFMTNPMVPAEYTNVRGGEVRIEKHVIIGAGSVILPALTIGEGACIGAMSLVKSDAEEWMVYAGVPVKLKGLRNRDIIELEKQFIARKKD